MKRGEEKGGMTRQKRLDRIADIIESVDHRAMAADGPVTSTRKEMTDDEMREIYQLSIGAIGAGVTG